MMLTLYLAGPINGCTDEDARGWREQVKRELATGYRFIDPMDADFRGHEDGNAAKIVRRDKAWIRQSTHVLANRWKASDGTPMEVQYAYGEAKHVIVIAAPPVSPWLIAHASRVVGSVAEAIAYLMERAA